MLSFTNERDAPNDRTARCDAEPEDPMRMSARLRRPKTESSGRDTY